MVRHLVFFALDPAASDLQRNALLEGLADLPNHFSDMKDFQLSANVSKRDNRFSHGMTMRFDTRVQLEKYLDSERHELFVAEHFRPFISERAIVSLDDQVS